MAGKERKKALLQQYVEMLQNAKSLCFITASGIKATDVANFRKELVPENCTFKMVKNTIFKLAFEEVHGEGSIEPIVGQYGVVVSYDDTVKSAKMAKEFIKDKEATLAFGFVEGTWIDESDVNELADLPSREVLIAQVMGTMQGVVRKLLGIMNGAQRDFVYLLQAYINKKEGK